MKKLVYLLAPLMCFSTLVSCGTPTPPGPEPEPDPQIFNVSCNEDIKIDQDKATEKEEYFTNISINKSDDKWVLAKDDKDGIKITVSGNPLSLDSFVYNLAEDMKTATLTINADKVTGDINITVPLIDRSDYYIVDFDSDGGSRVEPQLVKNNEKVTKPENPTKGSEGHYDFGYWHLVDQEGVEFDFNTPITQDIHLVAYWKVNPESMVRFYFTGILCRINKKSQYTEDLLITGEDDSEVYEVKADDGATLPETEDVKKLITNPHITYEKVDKDFGYVTVDPDKDETMPYKIQIIASKPYYSSISITLENCTIANKTSVTETVANGQNIEYLVVPAPNYELPSNIEIKSPQGDPTWINYDSSTGKLSFSPVKTNTIIDIKADKSVGVKIWNSYHAVNVNTRYDDEVGFKTDFAKQYNTGKDVVIDLYASNIMTYNNVQFYINGDLYPYDPKSSDNQFEFITKGVTSYQIKYKVKESINETPVSSYFVKIINNEDKKIQVTNDLYGSLDVYFAEEKGEIEPIDNKYEYDITPTYFDSYFPFFIYEKDSDTPCTGWDISVSQTSGGGSVDYFYHEADLDDKDDASVLFIRCDVNYRISGYKRG